MAAVMASVKPPSNDRRYPSRRVPDLERRQQGRLEEDVRHRRREPVHDEGAVPYHLGPGLGRAQMEDVDLGPGADGAGDDAGDEGALVEPVTPAGGDERDSLAVRR
jgi:hypothetical protein